MTSLPCAPMMPLTALKWMLEEPETRRIFQQNEFQILEMSTYITCYGAIHLQEQDIYPNGTISPKRNKAYVASGDWEGREI